MRFLVYIPTVIFLSILLWHMFRGFRRGFRKSLILFINMIIAFGLSIGIFCFIFRGNFDENVCIYIDTILSNFGMKFCDVIGTGKERTLFTDYILDYIANNLPQEFASLDLSQMLIMIFALCEYILRLVILIIIFFIYYILKFILYIIYLIFFKEGRYKKKVQNDFANGIRSKDYQRRRLFGTLIGTVRGLIVGVIIFSFWGGFCFTLTGGNYLNKEDSDLIDEELTEIIGSDISPYVNIITQYGTTGIGRILESVKGKNGAWYLLIADSLLTSKYEVTIDGEIVEGSFNLRNEMGPIVGFIKDAYILAREYGFTSVLINSMGDENSISIDIDMISDLFEKELNGKTFTQVLDDLVDEYNLGIYTLQLGQVFINTITNGISEIFKDNEMLSGLFEILFKGENAIKASEIVSNESLDTFLHISFDFLEAMPSIIKLFDSMSNDDSNESLVFGITPLNEETEIDYDIVGDLLISLADVVDSLNIINDNLITDVMIYIMEYTFNQSTENNIEIDEEIYSLYIESCYNTSLRNDISSLLRNMKDFIKYITNQNIQTEDELIEELYNNLDNDQSEIRKILDIFLNGALSSIILNNPYVITYLSDTLSISTNGLINLCCDLHLGCYYIDGKKYDGDIALLINNGLDVLKKIINMTSDENLDSDKILDELLNNKEISDLLISMIDNTNDKYIKTIHCVISSVLININNVLDDSSLRIVIEEEYIDNNLISSADLKDMLNVLIEHLPTLLDENFDYKEDLTLTLINDIVSVKLLRATMAEMIYSILSQDEQMSKYIPSSYELGKGNEKNLSNWTGDGKELDCLINIINAGNEENDLFDLVFNIDTSSDDVLNDFLDLDIEVLQTFENELLKSNVINCVLAGMIETLELSSGIVISIPNMCLGNIDDQKKIIKDINIFSILKETGLFDHINTDNSKTSVINYIFSEDFDAKKIFDNAILNSILVQILSKVNNNTITIIIPTSSYYYEALVSGDEVVKTEEIITTIDILKQLLNKDDNNEYDLNSIKYNEIFNIDISNCDIIGATTANIMNKDIAKNGVIRIPVALQNVELKDEYITSGWKDEIISIIDGMKAIDVEFKENSSNFEIDINEIVQNLNKITDNSKNTNLDRIYSSDILKLTVYFEFEKMSTNTSKIYIPQDALIELGYKTEQYYIDKIEIQTLTNFIEKFEITNINDFKVKEVFANNDNYDYLNVCLQNSYTLRYNVTYYINSDESIKNKIFIPSMSYDSTTISQMISTSEASSLIEVVKICGDLDNFNYDKLFEKEQDELIELINDSYIIRCTLSNNLSSNSDIHIPRIAYENRDTDDEMLTKDEVTGLVRMLKTLNMTSSEGFDFNKLINNNELDENELDELIELSSVLRYTITNNMPLSITVPFESYEYTSYIEYNEKIIEIEELQALFNVMEELSLSDTGDFDFNNFLRHDSKKLSDLLNSSLIMRATITTSILDTKELVVSVRALDKEYVQTDIITKEELQYFLNGINLMGIDSLEKTDVSIKNVSSNINNILNSEILLDTISYELYVCDTLLESKYNYITSYVNNNDALYVIQKEEIITYINTIQEILGENAKYGDTINLNDMSYINALNTIKLISNSHIMLTTYSDVVYDWLNNKHLATDEILNEISDVCSYDNQDNQFKLIKTDIIDIEKLESILENLNM